MKTSFFIRTTMKDQKRSVRIRVRLWDGKNINIFGVAPELI